MCLQAAYLAEEVLKTEYDAAFVIFNRFQTAISFKPTISTVLSPDVSFLSATLSALRLHALPAWDMP